MTKLQEFLRLYLIIICVFLSAFGYFLIKQSYNYIFITSNDSLTQKENNQFFHANVDANILSIGLIIIGLFFGYGFKMNYKYFYSIFIIVNIMIFYLFYFENYDIYRFGKKVNFNWPACKSGYFQDSQGVKHKKDHCKFNSTCNNVYEFDCGCNTELRYWQWGNKNVQKYIERVDKKYTEKYIDEYYIEKYKTKKVNKYQNDNENFYYFLIIEYMSLINDAFRYCFGSFNSIFDCDGTLTEIDNYYTLHSSSTIQKVYFLDNPDIFEYTIKIYKTILRNTSIIVIFNIVSSLIIYCNFQQTNFMKQIFSEVNDLLTVMKIKWIINWLLVMSEVIFNMFSKMFDYLIQIILLSVIIVEYLQYLEDKKFLIS